MAQVYQSPVRGRMMDYDCDIKNTAKKNWDCCDLKQFCAKIDTINKQADKKELTRNKKKIKARQSADGEGKFRKEWNAKVKNMKNPESKFYHKCAANKAKKKGWKIGSEMQPDHVHEIQLGGHPTHQGNLKWLSTSVNQSIGSILKQFEPKKFPGGIMVSCCPAEEQECRGKKDSDKLV